MHTQATPVPQSAPPESLRVVLALASDGDRQAIYRMRHDVYARELGQHPENSTGMLCDALDDFNIYIVAKIAGQVVGFVSVTPPGHGKYSIDKYLPRGELPFACDAGLYEVRILTVAEEYRRRPLALLLMYGALRYIQSRGGTRIVAIGRREVLGIYLKSGLRPLNREIVCGKVCFELLTMTMAEAYEALGSFDETFRKLSGRIDWQMSIPFQPPAPCFHGGAFFDAIGDEFVSLHKRHDIINADVLDAWFAPAPGVIEAISGSLAWLIRTSPPAGCEGMVRTIARVRGVGADHILPGGGSSDLIFLALRHWLTAQSRVLLLDPTYGEYLHVLKKVIGCRVDRLTLSRDDEYMLTSSALHEVMADRYDLIVLVNPNSPTGRHMAREQLEPWLRRVAPRTRVWIDETYMDYVGAEQSLERTAAGSENVVVCKSMSKVYALSGLRAAYLCGPASWMAELRSITPPWAVSLPAQVAAVRALADPDYYRRQYQQTHVLRQELAEELTHRAGLSVIPGVANFLLTHLSPNGPDAASVVAACRQRGVYLRDASGMGTMLGKHALRVAVKSRDENREIVRTLEALLR